MNIPELDTMFLPAKTRRHKVTKVTQRDSFRVYKLSPKVTDHPAVQECCSAEEGIRYDVLLKDGYHFAALDCNAAESDYQNRRRTGLFKSVKDFLSADPRPFDH